MFRQVVLHQGQCLEISIWWGRDATHIWWIKAKEADKNPAMPRKSPTPIIIWSKISIVLLLRNLVLEKNKVLFHQIKLVIVTIISMLPTWEAKAFHHSCKTLEHELNSLSSNQKPHFQTNPQALKRVFLLSAEDTANYYRPVLNPLLGAHIFALAFWVPWHIALWECSALSQLLFLKNTVYLK